MSTTGGSHFGLPVIDVTERFDATDWAAVPRCRPDDIGVDTVDGRKLTTEEQILAFWLAPRGADA